MAGAVLHLVAMMLGASEFAGTGLAQGTPMLNSNIDQTTATGPRGRSLPVAGYGYGPVALPDDIGSLRLAPSDTLAMEVFNVPVMSREITVDEAGIAVVPLLGPVPLAGCSLREAEERIAKLLKEKQLVNAPTVSLRMLAYARQAVTVSGEVQNPGKIQIMAPRSLLDVLALAGGETTAAGAEVEIRHRDEAGNYELQRVPYAAGKDSTAAQHAKVSPGDDVYVERAGVIYILGAVQRPGGYLMVSGGTLTVPQALALAVGTTVVASAGDLLILRKQGGQITRFTASLKKQETGKQPPFVLTDGDILYVPTSKIKAIFVNSQAVLSSAASAGIIGALQR